MQQLVYAEADDSRRLASAFVPGGSLLAVAPHDRWFEIKWLVGCGAVWWSRGLALGRLRSGCFAELLDPLFQPSGSNEASLNSASSRTWAAVMRGVPPPYGARVDGPSVSFPAVVSLIWDLRSWPSRVVALNLPMMVGVISLQQNGMAVASARPLRLRKLAPPVRFRRRALPVILSWDGVLFSSCQLFVFQSMH